MGAVAVVRIRGHANVRDTIEKTLESLNLTRANHCVIVPDSGDYVGMVRKVKDYVTFGSITQEEVTKLIKERGRLIGDALVTDAHVSENSDFASVEELAAAVAEGSYNYKDLPGVKPIFRLHPPRRGHKGGTKRSFQAHGSLGDRGGAMAELLTRMM